MNDRHAEDPRRRAEDRASPSWVGPVAGPRSGGAVLPVPEDGVVLSSHAHTPIGRAWMQLAGRATTGADAATPAGRRRLADAIQRGQSLARRGRVRALNLSPGVADATVVADGVAHPVLRVAPFDDATWDRAIAIVAGDLSLLGDLLEGQLPARAIEVLAAAGVPVEPGPHDLGADCDCGAFALPCAHVAALHHVLADVLDGDPFQLFTLRGRTRDQLLGGVRERLGARQDDLTRHEPDEEPPTSASWFAAPVEVPVFACAVPARVVPAAGLRALGPAPGDGELLTVLTPLYEAGAAAALERINHPRESVASRRALPRPADAARGDDLSHAREPKVAEPPAADATPIAAPEAPPADPPADLTAALLDLLAEREGQGTLDLARALHQPAVTVAGLLDALADEGWVAPRDGVWYLR